MLERWAVLKGKLSRKSKLSSVPRQLRVSLLSLEAACTVRAERRLGQGGALVNVVALVQPTEEETTGHR